MNNLKLVGIRPIVDCDLKICKILTIGVPYIFYHEYDFSEYSDNNRKVTIFKEQQPDLYSVTNSLNEHIQINISALVGENGSGKSSLVELFYVACYNISILKEVLFDEEEQRRLGIPDMVEHVNVELFYQLDNEFLLLRLQGTKLEVFESKNEIFILNKDRQFDLNDFFYTIAVNYSLHALNSEVLGLWVTKIFHKNDGYQTPIVLNPYRTEGNIEINNEEYLVKSRLISNVLGKISRRRNAKESLRNIINDKIAYRLLVSINKNKFKYDDNDKEKKLPIFELTEKYGERILPEVYHYFLKNRTFQPKDTLLNKYAKEYIIRKLISIAAKYDPYKRLFQFFYEPGGELDAYLTMLSREGSHVTFKLIQTLSFLSNEFYIHRGESFNLTINYLSTQLSKQAELKDKELIDILPPGFFKINIEFKDKGAFDELSSGEKQRVYSISTIVYHLNNLSSTNGKTINYKYQLVNIIFDELELYFHPEMQRTLVNDILSNIKKMDLRKISSINMLFITHSPFILSDIPSQNMLMLKMDGLPIKEGLNLQTFGANIFDLLKQNFFLKEGPMGEIAKETINNTITWLNKPDRNMEEREMHRKIIGIIGEPVLQLKLAEMFDNVTNESSEEELIRRRIADLATDLKRAQTRSRKP